MKRLCLVICGGLMVGAQALGQVAAPPSAKQPTAPETAKPSQPQPERPVPINRPREGRPNVVTPSGVTTPAPTVEIAGTGEKVDLRPRWTTGDTDKYEFEFTSRWTSTMGEGEKAPKGGQLYRQNGRMVRRVVSVDDTGTTIAVTMEKLHVQVSSGTQVVHYDSDFGDNPDRQNELTEPVKTCVGRQITIKLDRAGEIVSITGNENPAPDPANPNAPAKQIPQAILGTSAIKKLWRPLFGVQKKNLESRVGDTWTTSDFSTDPAIGTFDITITHTLDELKDGIAKINSKAEVMLTPAVGHGVVNATLSETDVKGVVEWNTTRGMLKSWETHQNMKLDTERSGEKQKLETQLSTAFAWIDPNAPKPAPKDPPKDSAKPADPSADHKKQ